MVEHAYQMEDVYSGTEDEGHIAERRLFCVATECCQGGVTFLGAWPLSTFTDEDGDWDQDAEDAWVTALVGVHEGDDREASVVR